MYIQVTGINVPPIVNTPKAKVETPVIVKVIFFFYECIILFILF
jgi:hypothetical protein